MSTDRNADAAANTATLYAAYNAAKEAFRLNRTEENFAAVKAAWTAYDASGPKRKAVGYASRAGKRQAAERRALSLRRR